MEDWQKELITTIETFTVDASIFIQEFTDSLIEVSNSFQDTFVTDLEAFWQDFCEFVDGNGDFTENSDLVNDFLNPKVEPNKDLYRACIGCSNYHGRLYGQNVLVCGMHPYGPTDEVCNDWEQDSKNT